MEGVLLHLSPLTPPFERGKRFNYFSGDPPPFQKNWQKQFWIAVIISLLTENLEVSSIGHPSNKSIGLRENY
jgi:hypothetical protein